MHKWALALLVTVAACTSDKGGSVTRQNVPPDAGMSQPSPQPQPSPTPTPPPGPVLVDLGGVDHGAQVGDMSMPMHPDGGVLPMDGGPMQPPVADGGAFMPPGSGDNPVVHAPPSPVSAAASFLGGTNVLDVSVDQGGGVWAATSSTIYYFPPGRSSPFTYDQKNGLARGWYTWTDTWFSPGTYPVTFTSVSGAEPGEVIVGNIGAIADRMQVNPSTGAVTRIDNMQVTQANTAGNPSEYPEHLKRVVAVWKSVVDLNGTFQGTSYLGGFHGAYAFHGLDADCGCLAFEEHQHFINDTTVGGGDVRGLAITVEGDLVLGDRDFVSILPQRSKGPSTGLFDYWFTAGIDVFPNVRDEVWGVAVDGSDGIWVASNGNGLAHLQPATYTASYFSAATHLPQNHLTSVAVDKAGDVWIGTAGGGVARLRPSTSAWTYYTQAGGLPSDEINQIYVDKLTGSGKVWLATHNGIIAVVP